MGAEFATSVTVSVSETLAEFEIGCVRAEKGLKYCFQYKMKGLICWRGCIALHWKESKG